MKKLVSLAVAACFIASLNAQQNSAPSSSSSFKPAAQNISKHLDPFEPFLKHVPKVSKVLSDSVIQNGDSSIRLETVLFTSRDNQNTVFAIIASPLHSEHAKNSPGILLLHGGGSGAADLLNIAKNWARQGYIALAPDLPGICGVNKASFSTGAWKKRPQGESLRFDLSNGPSSSTLADAEIAGIEAFNLLSVQPGIDSKNIGITGYSWGGYSTTMLAGLLGKRVKAAYAVFGCGFYDKGSFWKNIIDTMPADKRQVWLTYFDAGRRAKFIKAAYFIESATNDTYFWPEAVMGTLSMVADDKNHAWNPNLNHVQGIYGSLMQQLYFDYYLKDKGKPFEKITILKIDSTPNGDKTISIEVKLPDESGSVDSINVYYSRKKGNWQSRIWMPLGVKKVTNNYYTAVIPGSLVKEGIHFFARVIDDRHVVASSLMY